MQEAQQKNLTMCVFMIIIIIETTNADNRRKRQDSYKANGI